MAASDYELNPPEGMDYLEFSAWEDSLTLEEYQRYCNWMVRKAKEFNPDTEPEEK